MTSKTGTKRLCKHADSLTNLTLSSHTHRLKPLISVHRSEKYEKQDALVQSTSIRLLEVEQLLSKLNTHYDKHTRKNSKQMQDCQQVIHYMHIYL